MHPIENYPLSNKKKINQIRPLYDAMRVFPVKHVLSKKSGILFLVGGAVNVCAHEVRA